MIYRPYYYTYYDYPYFESKYVSRYNKQYSPDSRLSRKIKLNDGTVIEGFGYNINFMWIFVILMIFILILTKK
jgi:hypothetical protein